MKKFGIFILGFICGVGCLILLSIITNINKFSGFTAFETPGECVTYKPLEVFQSLEPGIALAHTSDKNSMIVLLVDETEKSFYDNEIIKIPDKMCARQFGVYKYDVKAGFTRTVPAVILDDSNTKK